MEEINPDSDEMYATLDDQISVSARSRAGHLNSLDFSVHISSQNKKVS